MREAMRFSRSSLGRIRRSQVALKSGQEGRHLLKFSLEGKTSILALKILFLQSREKLDQRFSNGLPQYTDVLLESRWFAATFGVK